MKMVKLQPSILKMALEIDEAWRTGKLSDVERVILQLKPDNKEICQIQLEKKRETIKL